MAVDSFLTCCRTSCYSGNTINTAADSVSTRVSTGIQEVIEKEFERELDDALTGSHMQSTAS